MVGLAWLDVVVLRCSLFVPALTVVALGRDHAAGLSRSDDAAMAPRVRL